MEGTKHEKAVLILLAYVVGFTSGFIAFGVSNQTMVTEEIVYSAPIEQPSTIAQTEPVTEVTEAPTETNTDETLSSDYTAPPVSGKGTEAYYQNNRLFVSVDGNVNLLSVAKSKLTAEVSSIFANQGSHVAIPKYAVSPDGKYVYFCEQQTDKNECLNFVYDVTNQVIQYVVLNGAKFSVSSDAAKTASWNNGKLTIGDYTSADVATPWRL